MLNSRKISLAAFLIFCFCFAAFAQRAITDDQRDRRDIESARQKSDMDLESRRKAMEALSARETRVTGSNKPVLSKEEQARLKTVLSPGAEDTAKYKDFLKQNKAGLFRLFPDLNCQVKNVIRVDGNCANLVTGSWNYSFRQKDYIDAKYFDLTFKDGYLISNGFLSQGVLTNLGDVPLETVSSESLGTKFLIGFSPEAEMEKIKQQFVEIAKGINSNGYRYAKNVKAELSNTYALRVVAYRSENKFKQKSSDKTGVDYSLFTDLNEIDKRIDMTVIFRVVNRDKNGSITILWKELNRQDSPKIRFDKDTRPSDINPTI